MFVIRLDSHFPDTISRKALHTGTKGPTFRHNIQEPPSNAMDSATKNTGYISMTDNTSLL